MLLFLIAYDAAVIEGAIIGKLVEPILQLDFPHFMLRGRESP